MKAGNSEQELWDKIEYHTQCSRTREIVRIACGIEADDLPGANDEGEAAKDAEFADIEKEEEDGLKKISDTLTAWALDNRASVYKARIINLPFMGKSKSERKATFERLLSLGLWVEHVKTGK